MSNFEKVAASPETLGAFLSSLHVATGPWDESFHRDFCDSCERESCDVENCPNQGMRNNPTWWLRLDAGQDEQAGCITLELERASIRDTLRKQLELLAYTSSGKPYSEEGKLEPVAPRDLVPLTVAMCRVAELIHELDERAAKSAPVVLGHGETMRFCKGTVHTDEEMAAELFQAMWRFFVTDAAERGKQK